MPLAVAARQLCPTALLAAHPSSVQPTLCRLLGVEVEVQLRRRGYFPKGGGEVEVVARPLGAGQALPAFDLTRRGQVRRSVGGAVAGGGRDSPGWGLGGHRFPAAAAAGVRVLKILLLLC